MNGQLGDTSSQSQPTERKRPRLELRELAFSILGTGSVAATPWNPQMDYPRCLRLVRTIFDLCFRAFMRWTCIFLHAHMNTIYPYSWVCSRCGITIFSVHKLSRSFRTTRRCGAFPIIYNI